MARRTSVVAVALTALMLIGQSPAEAVRSTGVFTSKKTEEHPAVAPGWLAWSVASVRTYRYTLFAQADGGDRFKVNRPGTEAFPGTIDGDRLVYTELAGSKGDIVLFDLQARTHSTPSGVNTAGHEATPSVSGDWLLFQRSTGVLKGPQSIILRNLVTGEERILGTGNSRKGYVQPGSVSGDFATWYKCQGFRNCTVYRYQISTSQSVAVPHRNNRAQFATSVTPDGTVYFVESLYLNCGKRAALWRFTPDGQRQRLGPLPRGHDSAITSPIVNPDGSTTVFFDSVDCLADDYESDIRKMTV